MPHVSLVPSIAIPTVSTPTLPEFRVTRPDNYLSPGCPGHRDPGSRQGYYVRAVDMGAALLKVRVRESVAAGGYVRDSERLEIDIRHCRTCGAWKDCQH